MNSIQRSFALIKGSRQVFAINPALAWYPVVALGTFIATLVLFVTPTMAGIGYLLYRLGIITEANGKENFWLFLPILFVYFLVFQCVAIFTNSAFYLTADAALNGEKLSLKAAFKQAWQFRLRIVQWALLGVIVGLFLSIVQEKLGWLGRITGFLGSLAWALVSIFVIPIIIRENVGPIEAVKRSAGLFKKTWGENLVMAFSMAGLVLAFLIFFFALGSMVMGLTFSGDVPAPVGITLGLILLAPFIMLVTYLATLQTIFNAALFRYAQTGDYIGPFPQEMIQGAFYTRPNKIRSFFNQRVKGQ